MSEQKQEQTKEQDLKKIKWAAKMQAKYAVYSEPSTEG